MLWIIELKQGKSFNHVLCCFNIVSSFADRDEKGRCKMTAKVSDFGLSKTFYDNIRYTRQNQHYIPWKWMALEYLQNGHLTITSDVWSYGVILWEIFSFGKEPYINVSVEDMLSQLKSGYYLQCPEDASKVPLHKNVCISCQCIHYFKEMYFV